MIADFEQIKGRERERGEGRERGRYGVEREGERDRDIGG